MVHVHQFFTPVKEILVTMKRWILILVTATVIGALIMWRLVSKSNDAKSLAQGRAAASKAAPPVAVAPVVARDIVQTFVGVGSVVAPFNVKVAPKVSGRLDFLQVREGAAVKQGEVIARIAPSQIQAQVNQQAALVAESESRLAEATINQRPNSVSVDTQIEQKAAGLASAQADAAQIHQNYNLPIAAARSAVVDAQGRLDNATATIANAEANIRSAQANLTNAQVRYNRTYDLYKQGFVAAQDVDDVKTTVKVQEEALGVTQGQLRSAQAARDSAAAQKASAEKQVTIVAESGKTDIRAADSKVALAASALKYAKSTTANQPAYKQNLAALRSAVNAAKAQLRNIQSQLSDTVLTSPISGFITARYVDAGAIVSPTQPVVAVQAIKDVFIDFSVPEDVAGHLHAGEPTEIVFDGLAGGKYSGTITQITPAADPQSRQFPVRTTLANRDNVVKPGMFARVTVVTRRIPGALVVPREAITRGKIGAEVVVVDADGTAHRRVVETGAEDAAGVQIREGVRVGDQVITLTNAPVKDGQKVRPGGAGQGTKASGRK